MRAERASRTALFVCYLRALADAGASHVRDFHDPTARVFLNERWSRRLAKVEQQLREGRQSMRLAIVRTSADMLALRTAQIDAAVRTAVANGTTQLVILGAGLDGRAWRMEELAGTRVFEVDHPATQAFKREHLHALSAPIADVEFVPDDFERDSLNIALARAGHELAQPTCWIWEGVVMYLTKDAMRETLASVAARSAEGSTLIVNYHTIRRRGPIGLLLRLIGEPDRSRWSTAEMAEELRTVGFRVIEDTGPEEWTSRFATEPIDTRRMRRMRIVVAQRERPDAKERP
jgi:methyltransferase (TIGR00027 family)